MNLLKQLRQLFGSAETGLSDTDEPATIHALVDSNFYPEDFHPKYHKGQKIMSFQKVNLSIEPNLTIHLLIDNSVISKNGIHIFIVNEGFDSREAFLEKYPAGDYQLTLLHFTNFKY